MSLFFSTHPSKDLSFPLTLAYSQIPPLMRVASPVTLPYTDVENRTVQLWKYNAHLVGSVDTGRNVRLIPPSKIRNPMSNEKQPSQLLGRLENIGPRLWHLVYLEKTNEIMMWPLLQGAGRREHHERILQHCRELYYGNEEHTTKKDLKGGNLDQKDQPVYQKDIKGNFLRDENGNKIPYDHAGEVQDSQASYKKIIKRMQNLLSQGDLHPDHRRRALELLSLASRKNDWTKKFVKPAKLLLLLALTTGSLYAKTPSDRHFRQGVQQTHLTKSYNANHRGKPIPARGAGSGQIGGVGQRVGRFEGLFDAPESIFDSEHHFMLPWKEGELPFSDRELKQLIREIAIGVYRHDTYPFFSLEFNHEGHLFPLIPPVYEDKLVGRVISSLDYMMKGFLNGGIFDEEFVENWKGVPHWNRGGAVDQLISFDHYFRLHPQLGAGKKKYQTLRQLFERERIKQEVKLGKSDPEFFNDHSQFSNSFRIISKQQRVEKTDHLFILHPDFDVEYTLAPNPEYENRLERFRRTHGRDPVGYSALKRACDKMCKRIHTQMATFPMARNYFAMLGVINFLSSYFTTLKANGSVPLLEPMALSQEEMKGSFPLFPELPVIKSDLPWEVLAKVDPTNYLLQKNAQSKRELKQQIEDLIWKEKLDLPSDFYWSTFLGFFSVCSALTFSSVLHECYKFASFTGVIALLLAVAKFQAERKRYFCEKRGVIRNRFNDRELFAKELGEVSDALILVIETLFEKFPSKRRESHQERVNRLVKPPTTYQYSLLQLELRKINGKFSPLVQSIPYPALFEESSGGKRGVEAGIAGGCAMNLEEQRVHPSKKARLLLEKFPALFDDGQSKES